jgi:hypothetical protein
MERVVALEARVGQIGPARTAALTVVAVPQTPALALAAQFASSGPARLASSRQQTQVISNAKLFWNLERHRAVSSSCSEHLACASRCAYDWYGYASITDIRICPIHCSSLYWTFPCGYLVLHGCVHPRMPDCIWRVFTSGGDRLDDQHGVHIQSPGNWRKWHWSF